MIIRSLPLLPAAHDKELATVLRLLKPFLRDVEHALRGKLTIASDPREEELLANLDGALVDVVFPPGTTQKQVENPLGRALVGMVPVLQVGGYLLQPYVKFNTTATDDGLDFVQNSAIVNVNVSAGTQQFATGHVGGWLMPTGSANASQERYQIIARNSATQVVLDRGWATAGETDIAGIAQYQMDQTFFYVQSSADNAWLRLWVF